MPTVFALITLTGRSGSADSRLEGDLAGVRRDQPVAGGLDAVVLAVWLRRRRGKRALFGAPGVHDRGDAVRAGPADPAIRLSLIGIIAIILLVLAILLIVEAVRTIRFGNKTEA